MQHSVVARHALWHARYVHRVPGARERRLGLGPGPVFTAAPLHRTVVQRPDTAPLVALRASWRSLVVASPRPAAGGRPRPGTNLTWTGSGRGTAALRPTVAPAWRA
jgi:hypothetical protein